MSYGGGGRSVYNINAGGDNSVYAGGFSPLVSGGLSMFDSNVLILSIQTTDHLRYTKTGSSLY